MRRDRVVLVGLCLAFAVSPGCACSHPTYVQPYPKPSEAAVLDALAARRAAARSFVAETTMDFRSDKDRVKTTVLVMGTIGARVRFNALDPAGGSTLADLACDGTDFTFVDFQKNCQLTGPCNQDAIASLLRLRLDPDDFVLMALGQVPLVADPRVTVEWDKDRGAEIVDLLAGDGQRRQRVVLNGKTGASWEIVESTVWDAAGKVEWKLSNKDFHDLRADDGTTLRVPAKSRLEQPSTGADLIVKWDERTLDPELGDEKFQLEPPPGLPTCGKAKTAGAAPSGPSPAN
jgi:hypothetical protein